MRSFAALQTSLVIVAHDFTMGYFVTFTSWFEKSACLGQESGCVRGSRIEKRHITDLCIVTVAYFEGLFKNKFTAYISVILGVNV